MNSQESDEAAAAARQQQQQRCVSAQKASAVLAWTKHHLRAVVEGEIEQFSATSATLPVQEQRDQLLSLFVNSPVSAAVSALAAVERATAPSSRTELPVADVETAWQRWKRLVPAANAENQMAEWRRWAPTLVSAVDALRSTQQAPDSLLVSSLLKPFVQAVRADAPLARNRLQALFVDALVRRLDAATACAVAVATQRWPSVFQNQADTIAAHLVRMERLGLSADDATPPADRCMGNFAARNPALPHRVSLGRGSYGSVVAACLPDGDCNYAIKTVRLGKNEDSDASRVEFENEARIAQLMSEHDIGPRYVAHWVCDNRGYLVTDKWDESLRDFADRVPFDTMPQQTERIASMLRQKVECAHGLGIAHMDLFPRNVLVRYEPDSFMRRRVRDVAIADWGLAQVIGGLPRVSPTQLWEYYSANRFARDYAYDHEAWDVLQRPQDVDFVLVDYLMGRAIQGRRKLERHVRRRRQQQGQQSSSEQQQAEEQAGETGKRVQ